MCLLVVIGDWKSGFMRRRVFIEHLHGRTWWLAARLGWLMGQWRRQKPLPWSANKALALSASTFVATLPEQLLWGPRSLRLQFRPDLGWMKAHFTIFGHKKAARKWRQSRRVSGCKQGLNSDSSVYNNKNKTCEKSAAVSPQGVFCIYILPSTKHWTRQGSGSRQTDRQTAYTCEKGFQGCLFALKMNNWPGFLSFLLDSRTHSESHMSRCINIVIGKDGSWHP